MRFYEASVDIDASPEVVWPVLVDAGAWPSWDSGVEAVTGQVASGEKITISSAVAPGRAFPVRVTALEPPRRLVFWGGMPLGLFTGERTYGWSRSTRANRAFGSERSTPGPCCH